MNKLSSSRNVAVMFRTYCVAVRLPKHGFVMPSFRNTFPDQLSEVLALGFCGCAILILSRPTPIMGGKAGWARVYAQQVFLGLISKCVCTQHLEDSLDFGPGDLGRKSGIAELQAGMCTTECLLSFCS